MNLVYNLGSPNLSPAPAVSSPDIESADAQLPPSDDASSPVSGDQDANSTEAASSEADKATGKKVCC